ncbi:hypothetical protein F5B20DRAFT_585167 [Whalleya microplaca]|nr:hypothetical protein F5B20DRAFT_585167 [Whalleya microplaca]
MKPSPSQPASARPPSFLNGCCFSRPAGPNAPYPGGEAASPSARAINNSPPSATDDDNASASAPASRGHHSHQSLHPHAQHHTQHHHHPRPRTQRPLSQHIDKPLRRHEWAARDRAWTRAQLDSERADFFDTRVAGRPEVWQVLRAALEVLWEADILRQRQQQLVAVGQQGQQARNHQDEDGSAVGLATAQSILRAAEVTLPTGDLANGAYDQLGNYYALPEWIVCDPVNVAEGSGGGGVAAGRRRDDVVVVDRKGDEMEEEDTAEELDEDEALRRREEKGKGVADIKNMVKVRARLSENMPDVVVSVGAEESVRSLARKVAEESGLISTKRVRVAYMGKILKEASSVRPVAPVAAFVFTSFSSFSSFSSYPTTLPPPPSPLIVATLVLLVLSQRAQTVDLLFCAVRDVGAGRLPASRDPRLCDLHRGVQPGGAAVTKMK